jgi:hypothetical protein
MLALVLNLARDVAHRLRLPEASQIEAILAQIKPTEQGRQTAPDGA